MYGRTYVWYLMFHILWCQTLPNCSFYQTGLFNPTNLDLLMYVRAYVYIMWTYGTGTVYKKRKNLAHMTFWSNSLYVRNQVWWSIITNNNVKPTYIQKSHSHSSEFTLNDWYRINGTSTGSDNVGYSTKI